MWAARVVRSRAGGVPEGPPAGVMGCSKGRSGRGYLQPTPNLLLQPGFVVFVLVPVLVRVPVLLPVGAVDAEEPVLFAAGASASATL